MYEIALICNQLGIYSMETQHGWHHIGHRKVVHYLLDGKPICNRKIEGRWNEVTNGKRECHICKQRIDVMRILSAMCLCPWADLETKYDGTVLYGGES